MNELKQIEEAVSRLRKLPPTHLRELLNTAVPLDETHTAAAKDLAAKSLISIARNPLATRKTRGDAMRLAKQYLNDFTEGTQHEKDQE